jgi:hypothetical protein
MRIRLCNQAAKDAYGWVAVMLDQKMDWLTECDILADVSLSKELTESFNEKMANNGHDDKGGSRINSGTSPCGVQADKIAVS